MGAWEDWGYILSQSLLLKFVVALVSSLRVCFSFLGSKMKTLLDSSGMLTESLRQVKLCVLETICVNEMYISDRSLDFLWAFLILPFS